MTAKLIASWLLGGVLIAAAAWLLGHVQETVGVSPVAYAVTFFIGLVLVLVGGLAWISVATATAKH
jgi:hypothetical protein